MIKAVIIDDEKAGRDNLHALLAKYCPQVKVVAQAQNPLEAKLIVKAVQPQLVFLDIEMPFGSGFDLLKDYDTIPFEVIFVTAFEKYALQAIRLSACDFIMKPVEITELIAAVNKAAEHIASKEENLHLKILLENIKEPYEHRKIALPTLHGMIFTLVAHIIRLEADGSYTWFHFAGRDKLLATKNIGSYEEILEENIFIRVHHHHIVNLNHITEFQRANSPIIIMSDGSHITVSQRKREALVERLPKLR